MAFAWTQLSTSNSNWAVQDAQVDSFFLSIVKCPTDLGGITCWNSGKRVTWKTYSSLRTRNCSRWERFMDSLSGIMKKKCCAILILCSLNHWVPFARVRLRTADFVISKSVTEVSYNELSSTYNERQILLHLFARCDLVFMYLWPTKGHPRSHSAKILRCCQDLIQNQMICSNTRQDLLFVTGYEKEHQKNCQVLGSKLVRRTSGHGKNFRSSQTHPSFLDDVNQC